MHKLDEQTVRHIARLARLGLSDDEIRRFTIELGDILGYVEQLNAIDTSSVEPTAHALPLVNVLRDDEPHQPLTPDQALSNAPQREGSHFGLPKVLEQEGA